MKNPIHISSQQILAFMFALFVFLSICLLCTTATAYCVTLDDIDTKFETAVTKIANEIYIIARSIVCPLCIVALCIAAFQFIAGGNRGADKARSIVVACLIAIIIVALSPTIISTIATLVNNKSGSDSNPLSSAK